MLRTDPSRRLLSGKAVVNAVAFVLRLGRIVAVDGSPVVLVAIPVLAVESRSRGMTASVKYPLHSRKTSIRRMDMRVPGITIQRSALGAGVDVRSEGHARRELARPRCTLPSDIVVAGNGTGVVAAWLLVVLGVGAVGVILPVIGVRSYGTVQGCVSIFLREF